jgi:hypothetical protein
MATALVAAAGEHFVAYKLSMFDLPVALTRGGSPGVDLMVGDLTGRSAISFQVKTSRWARRDFTRKPENNRWEWDVGPRAATLDSEALYYAFVDLRVGAGGPDVFVVPSPQVAATFRGTAYKRNMYWIAEHERGQYLEAWNPVIARLRPAT